jgi:hypothetical protein
MIHRDATDRPKVVSAVGLISSRLASGDEKLGHRTGQISTPPGGLPQKEGFEE